MILTNDGSPALEVLRRLKVDFTPIHFLRNGLPEGLFTPGPRPAGMLAELGLPEDAYVLMSVTRLHSEKRLDRMIRVLATLRREIPAAVAVILGEGPEREALTSLAARLGVTDAVRFVGAVKNAELPGWFRLSDVILSLLDRTNASNPVFEAMSCECCVVALNAGTTAEVVRHEETGILIDPGREAEIERATVRALADLSRDRRRRAAIGKRARPWIQELCGTVEARMRREIGIIEEVARTRATVPGNLA
jgi:glycosyltransferase involved in cell wall biosynthesis